MNSDEKGFIILESIRLLKAKNMKHFVSLSILFSAKMGRPRPATYL